MMMVYYTHNYSNLKGESHRLLGQAIAEYLCDAGGSASPGEAQNEASRLVETMRTSGEFGKPYIPGFAPFSISHSVNTWAVLIADAECGLDVQYAKNADAEAIAGRFYAEEDAALIADSVEKAEVFFRMWVRREALVKAAGTSVAGSDIPSVIPDEVVYEGSRYRLEDIDIPGCSAYAAVCLEAAAEAAGKLKIRELRWDISGNIYE